MDSDLHPIGVDGEPPTPTTASITLGDRVLIGSRCSILKGVTIADGCVVAAGSVVTRSEHTPGSLLAGVPARAVRTGVTWA